MSAFLNGDFCALLSVCFARVVTDFHPYELPLNPGAPPSLIVTYPKSADTVRLGVQVGTYVNQLSTGHSMRELVQQNLVQKIDRVDRIEWPYLGSRRNDDCRQG